jgi:hypothetical protein
VPIQSSLAQLFAKGLGVDRLMPGHVDGGYLILTSTFHVI